MASVAQRGNRFSVRFRFEGQNLRVTVESRAKAESVRLVAENTLTDLRLQRITMPPGVDPAEFIASGGKAAKQQRRLNFKEASDRWKSQRVAAETTRQGEAKHLKRLVAFFGETDLSRLDVQSYVNDRTSDVSPQTIRKELVTLRSVLLKMRREGCETITFNASDLSFAADEPKQRFASLATTSDGRRTLLSPAEVSELREIVRQHGSELIADVTDFVALTGARRSEVCRLRVQDIDFEKGTLTLTEKKRRHGHTTYRTLHIHNELREILLRRSEEGELIFTDSINTLSSGFRDAIEGTKFDLPGFGYHALRHSAASRLLAQNVSAVTVANVLGHATCQTTLGIYAHAFDDDCSQAIAML